MGDAPVICTTCNGTRLKPLTDYKDRRLYTDEECGVCGGKGYFQEGEREYVVTLFADETRRQQFWVMGRSAGEALLEAAGLFQSVAQNVKPGEVIALVVEEQ